MFQTLPRSHPTSPAMQRINARAAEIWSEVKAAKAALEKVDRQFEEKKAELQSLLAELQETRAAISEYRPEVSRVVLIRKIKEEACSIFGMSEADLKGDGREWRLVTARYYAAQRLRDEGGLSTTHIGRILGGRDHTTIMHAIKPAARERVAVWLSSEKA